MCLPAEYDVVLLCTQYTVQASMLCAHLPLYEPLRFALIVTSMTHYLIRSKGLRARSHTVIAKAISQVIAKLWITKPFLRL